MASFRDKLIHLVGEGGWELAQNRNTGNIDIEWSRAGSPPTNAEVDAVTDADADATAATAGLKRGFELSKKDKVLIKWIASRTGGGTASSIKQELKTIWNNTN